MLTCFKYELLKLSHRKILLTLVAFCLTAFCALLTFEIHNTDNVDASQYKEVYGTIESLKPEEALEKLEEQAEKMEAFLLIEDYEWELSNYGPSAITEQLHKQILQAKAKYGSSMDVAHDFNALRKELAAIEHIRSEVLQNYQYHDYLDNIQKMADTLGSVSIFEKQTNFSAENIQKTAYDMAKMKDVSITPGAQKGVLLFTHHTSTDIFALLILFVIVYFIFFDEKENGLFSLTKTTPFGITQTYFAKLWALLFCMFMLWIKLYGITAGFAITQYGLGDVWRSIQSVGAFQGSNVRVSVLGMLCLSFVSRIAGSFLVGLIFMLFTTKTKHAVLLSGLSVLAVGFNFLLTNISPQSAFSVFRYSNLYTLFNPCSVLAEYENINAFGMPLNTKTLLLLFGAAVLGMSIATGFVLYRKDFDSSKALHLPRLFKPRFAMKYTSLIGMEFHKMRLLNKALILIVAYAVFQGIWVSNFDYYRGPEEHYYANYMSVLQGEINNDKIKFIQEEKESLERLEAQSTLLNEAYANGAISYADLQDGLRENTVSLYRQNAFQRVYAQYEYITEHPQAHFVYDSGYTLLLGVAEEQQDFWLLSAVLLCAMMILCIGNVFAQEHSSGMIALLRTTKRGVRPTITTKIIVASIVVTVLFLLSYIPLLSVILSRYGCEALSSPLSSIPAFAEVAHSSILGGVLIVFTVRYTVTLFVTLILLGLSSIIKRNMYVIAVACFALVIPLLMHSLGIELFDYISLYKPLVTTQMLFEQEWLPVFLVCAGYGGFAAVSLYSLYRKS